MEELFQQAIQLVKEAEDIKEDILLIVQEAIVRKFHLETFNIV